MTLLFDTPLTLLPPPLAMVAGLWVLAAGLCIGSFVNVVIARLPQGMSVVRPRSACPQCKHPIAWYDNLPLLSWVWLRARCRHCRAPIPWRYPLVEVLAGGLALALSLRWGLSLATLELFVFAMALLALTFIDIDTFEVPYALLAVVVGNGIFFGGVAAWFDPELTTPLWLRGVGDLVGAAPWIERGAGILAGFLSLACVNVIFTWWFRVRGRLDSDQWAMGWGDPLLLGAMGATLGWRALALVIFLAASQGACVGLVLQWADRMPASRGAGARGPQPDTAPVHGAEETPWEPPPTAVPFVPFLALAGLEVAFFGASMLTWLAPFFPGWG